MSEDVPHTDDGDGLEVADPNDFFITGGGDKPDPVTQRIPGTDQAVRVHPLMNEQLERWSGDLDDPDDAMLAEVFDYALADFDGEITEKMVREGLIGYNGMPLLQAIKNASNYRAFLGYREQQMEMADMVKNLDEEQMDILMDFAERNGKHSGGTS